MWNIFKKKRHGIGLSVVKAVGLSDETKMLMNSMLVPDRIVRPHTTLLSLSKRVASSREKILRKDRTVDEIVSFYCSRTVMYLFTKNNVKAIASCRRLIAILGEILSRLEHRDRIMKGRDAS